MGVMRDTAIEMWRKQAGIVPSRHTELLEELSQAAFELIKVIELEKSGIRDGDGYWSGSDAMGGTLDKMVRLCSAYMEASRSAGDF